MNKYAFMILSFLAVILFILMIIFDSVDNENVTSVGKDSARRQAEQKVVMREQSPPSVNEPRNVFQKSETFTSSKVPADGLVAYYPFSGNADDASGNGNNGTVHGATLTEDRFGNPNSAYYFDGNSWIEVKDSPNLKPANSLTVCAWVNLEYRDVDDYMRILSKHGEVTDAGGSHGSYQLITGRLKDRGAYNMTLKTNQKYDYTRSGSKISTPGWHFILGTWDGTTASVYHDGVLTGESKIGGNIIYDFNSLIIGKDGYYKHVNFKGSIDDIRIYNSPMNPEQVWGLYCEFGWANPKDFQVTRNNRAPRNSLIASY
nr:LamG domain-containing protein [Clostridiales bacterium]